MRDDIQLAGPAVESTAWEMNAEEADAELGHQIEAARTGRSSWISGVVDPRAAELIHRMTDEQLERRAAEMDRLRAAVPGVEAVWREIGAELYARDREREANEEHRRQLRRVKGKS